MGALAPRRCRAEELARLTAAATAIFRTPAAPGDLGREYPLLFGAENTQHLWVIERAGEILAHVGFCVVEAQLDQRRARLACFGAVFTVEPERGHGLSTRLLKEAVADARAAGAQIGLISGSRSLYQRVGFEPMAPVTFHLAPTGGPAPPDAQITVAAPADIPALARLYDAEPVHFVRSQTDWERLMHAGTLFYGPGHLLVVRRHGQPIGYGAFEARAAELAAAGSAIRVLEIAGDRAALAAALPLVRPHLGETPATFALVSQPHDEALRREAGARGWADFVTSLPHAAALWDARLSDAPTPWYGLNYV